MDELINHAITHAWCNPERDAQLVFKMHRISSPWGERNSFALMARKIALPEASKTYHVYQIGQLYPGYIHLNTTKPSWIQETWLGFDETKAVGPTLVQVFTGEGVMLAKARCHYLFTRERDLIVALEANPKYQVDFEHDSFYLRLYKNAYFETPQGSQELVEMSTGSLQVSAVTDVLNLQGQIGGLIDPETRLACFVNGFKVRTLDLTTIKIGDLVEWVYDSSMKKLYTFTIEQLDVFLSTLDQCYKYLLLHSEMPGTYLEYQDDIDIYISDHADPARRSLMYPRIKEMSHRMVTMDSYSVVVDDVVRVAEALRYRLYGSAQRNIAEFQIEVYVRASGNVLPMIKDSSRMFELYKLSYAQRKAAMTQPQEGPAMWKAAALEASDYCTLMRSAYSDLTMELVERAYGYNALSQALNAMPIQVSSQGAAKVAQVSLACQQNSTIYEYDSQGLLLGSYYHATGSQYICQNSSCAKIEGIPGQSGISMDVTFGEDLIQTPLDADWRVYMCYKTPEGIAGDWRDITGSNLYTVDAQGVLHWANLEVDQYLMVRTNKSFLDYSFDLSPINGNLFFTLYESQNRDGTSRLYALPVPMGNIDIFLNGRSLVHGIDYIVSFPKVHILNKRHLVNPVRTARQRIHVRMTGFCDENLHADPVEDSGFVKHGYLSENDKYDLRDDKLLRITVGGSLKSYSDLVFAENHPEVSVTSAMNGMPYEIKDMFTPFGTLTANQALQLRTAAQVTDKIVGDYMHMKLPQTDTPELNVIVQLHPVVSPFVARIIDALESDEIRVDQIAEAVNDNAILALCKPFEDLLVFDPLSDEQKFDADYVTIHPHIYDTVVGLPVVKYRFAMAVVRLYANSRINLASFLTTY